jgi:hypothetical protein
VLAAFAVTLVAGLAVMFGVHRFVTAYLLNVWFIISLAVAAGFHHAAQNANYTLATHFTSYTWAQVLAWAGGVGAVDRAELLRVVDPRAPRPVPAVHGAAR